MSDKSDLDVFDGLAKKRRPAFRRLPVRGPRLRRPPRVKRRYSVSRRRSLPARRAARRRHRCPVRFRAVRQCRRRLRPRAFRRRPHRWPVAARQCSVRGYRRCRRAGGASDLDAPSAVAAIEAARTSAVADEARRSAGGHGLGRRGREDGRLRKISGRRGTRAAAQRSTACGRRTATCLWPAGRRVGVAFELRRIRGSPTARASPAAGGADSVSWQRAAAATGRSDDPLACRLSERPRFRTVRRPHRARRNHDGARDRVRRGARRFALAAPGHAGRDHCRSRQQSDRRRAGDDRWQQALRYLTLPSDRRSSLARTWSRSSRPATSRPPTKRSRSSRVKMPC